MDLFTRSLFAISATGPCAHRSRIAPGTGYSFWRSCMRSLSFRFSTPFEVSLTSSAAAQVGVKLYHQTVNAGKCAVRALRRGLRRTAHRDLQTVLPKLGFDYIIADQLPLQALCPGCKRNHCQRSNTAKGLLLAKLPRLSIPLSEDYDRIMYTPPGGWQDESRIRPSMWSRPTVVSVVSIAASIKGPLKPGGWIRTMEDSNSIDGMLCRKAETLPAGKSPDRCWISDAYRQGFRKGTWDESLDFTARAGEIRAKYGKDPCLFGELLITEKGVPAW